MKQQMVYGVLCDVDGSQLEKFFIGPRGEATEPLLVRSGFACFPRKYYIRNYQ